MRVDLQGRWSVPRCGAVVVTALACLMFSEASHGLTVDVGMTPGQFAADITVDGSLDEWRVGWIEDGLSAQVNRSNSDWFPRAAGVNYWVEDGIGCHSYVGPGYGGQNFDNEAGYLGLTEDAVNLALVTGMDQGGQYDWHWNRHYPGDIFFDVDADDHWEFVVATRTHNGIMVGKAYAPTSAYEDLRWWTRPGFSSSKPGNILKSRSKQLDWVFDFIYTNADTADDNRRPNVAYSALDHNVIELSIPWTALEDAGINVGPSVRAHYTHSCGNDVTEFSGGIPAPTEPPPGVIPEPGTLALMLSGVAAIGARKARKRRTR